MPVLKSSSRCPEQFRALLVSVLMLGHQFFKNLVTVTVLTVSTFSTICMNLWFNTSFAQMQPKTFKAVALYPISSDVAISCKHWMASSYFPLSYNSNARKLHSIGDQFMRLTVVVIAKGEGRERQVFKMVFKILKTRTNQLLDIYRVPKPHPYPGLNLNLGIL